MNTIAILPEEDELHPKRFRAVATDRKATGRTPGEALDALTSQLAAEGAGAAVVLQLFHSDNYFSAEQRERLSALMTRWRAARETGGTLPPAEQAELERLVEEELEGSAERAARMSQGLEMSRTFRRRWLDEKRLGRRAGSGTGSRRARRLSVAWLAMLANVVTCAVLLGAGFFERVGALIIVVIAADIIINLLFVLSTLHENWLIGRPVSLEVRQDSSEHSAGSDEQREQAGAR